MDIKHNLRTYGSLIKKYKGLFFLTTFVILLAEGTKVIDKFLFKLIIDKGTFFTDGSLVVENFISLLFLIAVVFISIIVFRALLNWIKFSLINNLEVKMIFDLKKKFFNHIIHLSHSFHTSHKTGSLISRLVRGGSAVERMTDVLVFNTFPLIFQFGAVIFSLLYFDRVSAIVVALTMVSFILYSFFIQRAQQEHLIFANRMEDREKAYVSDVFTNIDSIKYFGKENSIKNRFKLLNGMTVGAFLRSWNFIRWMDAGQSLIIGVGTFFLIYFPLMKLLSGELSIGTLVFIYTIYGNLMPPLYGFVHGMRNVYRAMADFEDLFQYAKFSNEIKDKVNAKRLTIKQGTITFKDLWFKYHDRYVLKEFDLNIKKNEKIAIVGHSGSGKSTLVKLLYRLHDPTRGKILIDGKKISDFKQESLRNELSIVPQECVLFDDTIYNNIAFSNPKASEKDVWRAIRFAQLDKTIRDFPKQEKTIVGERGVKLSGGEKQRVSIARALLANKKILVLDEATSSLDSETEHEIQSDLAKLMRGRTAIIIAHRLSTIMHADKIIVIEKGKIIQVGSHRQLIKKQGVYKKLWNLQKGGYIK